MRLGSPALGARPFVLPPKALVGRRHTLIELRKLITRQVCGRTSHGQVRCSLPRKKSKETVTKPQTQEEHEFLRFSRRSRGPVGRGWGHCLFLTPCPAQSPSLCAPVSACVWGPSVSLSPRCPQFRLQHPCTYVRTKLPARTGTQGPALS